MTKAPCLVSGCVTPVMARGYCPKHYERFMKHGDPLVVLKGGSHPTHGLSHLIEHRHWSRMKERCYNPHNKRYKHYGERGITVCDRWLGPEGFANFYADMGPRPGPKYTVDREDNDKGYSPDNCRWATPTEQSNNRGDYNRRMTVDGETMTVAEASRRTGISHGALSGRLNAGWTDEAAFKTPLIPHTAPRTNRRAA